MNCRPSSKRWPFIRPRLRTDQVTGPQGSVPKGEILSRAVSTANEVHQSYPSFPFVSRHFRLHQSFPFSSSLPVLVFVSCILVPVSPSSFRHLLLFLLFYCSYCSFRILSRTIASYPDLRPLVLLLSHNSCGTPVTSVPTYINPPRVVINPNL